MKTISGDGAGVAVESARDLARVLRREILGGRWRTGARVPSTRKVTAEYGVSRTTAHRALTQLEAEGLIECRERSGAFVRADLPGMDGSKAQDHTATAQRSRRAGGLIGLDIPVGTDAFSDSWRGHILRGCQDLFQKAGYEILLLANSSQADADLPAMRRRLGDDRYPLAGVLCVQASDPAPMRGLLDEHSVPWVMISRSDTPEQRNFVALDNLAGSAAVGQCFALAGYHNVLVLGTATPRWSWSSEKLAGFAQGYLSAAAGNGQLTYRECATSHTQDGYEATKQFLDSHEGNFRGGIFAVGDRLAIGAIRALRERGLRVPEDVGVVGGTGLELAGMSDPPLSVLEQPMEALGQNAAEMLLTMIRNRTLSVPGRVISGRIILRKSFTLSESQHHEAKQSTAIPINTV